MLATWLSTFFSRAGNILLLWCLDRTGRELPSSQNTPVLIALPLLPVWLSYTSCLLLANQRLFKASSKEYRIAPHQQQASTKFSRQDLQDLTQLVAQASFELVILLTEPLNYLGLGPAAQGLSNYNYSK